jgi:O-antigen biosynthesis protein
VRARVALFSPIGYSFVHQRPQAFADELVRRGHTVYFIEGPYRGGSLNRSQPWYSTSHAVRELRPGLYRVAVPRSLSVLGIRFRLSRAVMYRHVSRWMQRLFAGLGASEMVALYQTFAWQRVTGDIRFGKVIYDCIDDPDVLANEMSGDSYEPLLQALLARSAAIFATAGRLEASLRRRAPEAAVVRLPNGVDFDEFQGVAPREDMEKLRADFPKIAGYTGVLFRWIDIGLLEACAAAYPKCAFVLVGPYDKALVGGLLTRPNVFLVGARPHDEVPAYIESFDVCLNPFKAGSIAANTNPVKLYEYLAGGKPVLSTPLGELKNFGGLVESADTPIDFIERLGAMLAAPARPEAVAARKGFALEHTWKRRIDVLEGYL